MRRAWGWVAALLLCIPVLLSRADAPGLLLDSDTAVLLRATRERNDSWSWFVGDWPLENHFYRPLPTLLFEWDDRSGGGAARFGLTNALLVAGIVLTLFALVRELSGRVGFAVACAAVTAIHFIDSGPWVAARLGFLPLGLLIAGVAVTYAQGRKPGWAVLGPPLIALIFLSELAGRQTLWYRTIGWLPGRTATTVAVFALGAAACYARWERVSAPRRETPYDPFAPPATRSARPTELRPAPLWLAASFGLSAAAFASYEQAVMLPAVMLGIALTLRWRGLAVRWWPQLVFWGLLFGYLLLRRAVIPAGVSGYQDQQVRTGPGVYLTVLDYLLPVLTGFIQTTGWGVIGPLVLLTSAPYDLAISVAATVRTFVAARRDFTLPLAGWLLSTLAFLPMAWLQPFDHYHAWPMALRSILVVSLAMMLGRETVSGWSRPPRQAPPRQAP